MMIDQLVDQLEVGEDPIPYGVQWFDQWDTRQQIWLLERVASALLGPKTIKPQAAIFDAAADAIFMEVCCLIHFEIEDPEEIDSGLSWRQSVIDAFEFQNQRLPSIAAESDDISHWQLVVTQVADLILGVRLYQRAEAFRDSDFERTLTFLRDRGLHQEYLQRMPPLRTDNQTQQSVDRIQSIVFR